MGKALSSDLGLRVVKASDEGISARQAAARFGLTVVDILDAEPRAADVFDFGDDLEAAEFFGRNRHRDRNLGVAMMPFPV